MQSDNGEFSIEVPAEHTFFHNPDGFQLSNGTRDLTLKNMYMLNAFVDGTLVSIEIYDGGKDAAEALRDHDKSRDSQTSTTIKQGELRIKEIVVRNDRYVSNRRFLSSKGRVFVLTAASRNGETPAMKRFLDSFTVESIADGRLVKLSELKPKDISIEFDEDDSKAAKPASKQVKSAPDPAVKPLIVVNTPRASYAPAARGNSTAGRVRLKVEMANDGFVPRITVKRSLPDGLLRQSLFAAARIKFLPKEKDGIPVSVVQTMEFSFQIF